MSFLSIIIPVYNEEENVVLLFEKIQAACENLNESYEILFVDDGSQDNTFKVFCELHKDCSHLKVIRFEKNAGQTAAMAAGFEFAQGQRIISMDGDFQNDPADIPKLLEKLNENFPSNSWTPYCSHTSRVSHKALCANTGRDETGSVSDTLAMVHSFVGCADVL